MAGPSICLDLLILEQVAAFLLTTSVVVLLAFPSQDAGEGDLEENSNCEAIVVWNYRW